MITINNSDGSEQGGSRWGNDKWVYFEGDPIRFANALGMESKKMRELHFNSKVLV